MNNSITCPACKTDFEISSALRMQLDAKIRSELAVETATKESAIKKAQLQLKKDQSKLQDSEEEIAQLVKAGIKTETHRLATQAKKQAMADLAVETEAHAQELKETQSKLKESQANELQLRKNERDLKSREEAMKLQVARQMDAERTQIIDEAKKQQAEQQQLTDAEKEKQISGLRETIDLLKRKAEQGSQQLQGEVFELALEELLEASFPTDSVVPVAKGVRGGDVHQTVLNRAGLDCGQIMWETKRTTSWNNAWLAKARDDQRDARASCAVIVSQALPNGIQTFSLIEGVWVCSWKCVTGLATALRQGLIEVGKSKLAQLGQNQKMELVYNYLAGKEFQLRVAGVVEAFMTMKSDLESEKRAMTRIWSKREKQLERAFNNTAGLYGDVEGIIGASMPTIEGLTLPLIEDTQQQDKS
ncbi:MAG: DUF2130 domain-containing protein [Planctomycetota bacterium]